MNETLPMPPETESVRADPPLPIPAAVAGVVLFAAIALLAAVIEVVLVPVRIGTAVIPVAVLLAALSNVALPLMTRRIVDNALVSALPVGAWLVATVLLAGSRPEGDVLIPGTAPLEYVFYAMVLVGLVCGMTTVVRSENRRLPGSGQRPATLPTGTGQRTGRTAEAANSEMAAETPVSQTRPVASVRTGPA
jgi:hypothetical protein